jgi:hypothetical protein
MIDFKRLAVVVTALAISWAFPTNVIPESQEVLFPNRVCLQIASRISLASSVYYPGNQI